jgi:hypothetical protein
MACRAALGEAQKEWHSGPHRLRDPQILRDFAKQPNRNAEESLANGLDSRVHRRALALGPDLVHHEAELRGLLCIPMAVLSEHDTLDEGVRVGKSGGLRSRND